LGQTQRAIQVAPRRKEDVVYDHLPVQAFGNVGFRMGLPRRRLEGRLKKLAEYRKIHGTAILTATAKQLQFGKLGQNSRSQ
jgi:hypothetical protein